MHYYFNDPSSKPLHHRFSRGSYAYLYHDPAAHRAKLEVANHAGTPDQDALFGYLSAVERVRYSYKQPTVFTLTLDARAIPSQGEWHLNTFDERNEQKRLCAIHTLDVYLWTEKDAAVLLGHLQNVLSPGQLDIRDAPVASSSGSNLAEHRDSMSPVVQQLEKTAIGAHFHPRVESTNSVHSFPGPPTPATSGGAAVSPSPQQQPAPMAYNPAAPSAPEPIAHREKTPPPVDDGSGPGLSGLGGYGHTQYASVPHGFQPSLQNTPQQGYFPGPPAPQQRQPSFSSLPGPPGGTPPGGIQRTHSGSLPPPPPPTNTGPSPAQYTPSFGPPPTSQTTQPSSPPPTQLSFQPQTPSHPIQQFASFGPQSPGFPSHQQQQQQQQQQPPTASAPPSYNAHTPLQSPTFSPQTQAAQIAGYSSYSYATQPQPQQPGTYTPHAAGGAYAGDVHAQLYRPTEAESSAQAAEKSKRPVFAFGEQQQGQQLGQQQGQMQGQGQGQDRRDSASFAGKYKVNERVDKVEKGVGRFLRKLDSKW